MSAKRDPALGRQWALALSRATLGVIFVYFGADELYAPGPWVGYMPSFLAPHTALWLVLAHGFALFVVGAALIIGTQLRFAYPLATLLMGSIALDLLLTSGATAIWFRDLGLTALAVGSWASGEGISIDRLAQGGRLPASPSAHA